jgi:hypothetical protein
MGQKQAKPEQKSSVSATVENVQNEEQKPDYSMTMVFGVPLMLSLERSQTNSQFGAVPTVLYECILFINTKGLEEECIYRIPGDRTKIDSYINTYNSGKTIRFLEEHESKTQRYDPLNIARVVLHFLNNLPGGLLTEELGQRFLPSTVADAVKGEKDGKRQRKIAYLREVIHSGDFPQQNRSCLQLVVNHLMQVAKKSSINQMSVKNLVFCVFHMSKWSKTFSALIKYQDEIF